MIESRMEVDTKYVFAKGNIGTWKTKNFRFCFQSVDVQKNYFEINALILHMY